MFSHSGSALENSDHEIKLTEGLANATLANATGNYSQPQAYDIGKNRVMALSEIRFKLMLIPFPQTGFQIQVIGST